MEGYLQSKNLMLTFSQSENVLMLFRKNLVFEHFDFVKMYKKTWIAIL